QATGKSVSQICQIYDKVPQLLYNVKFSGGAPLDDAQVKDTILRWEKQLGAEGRLLIRASGTEPLIRIMAQGDDEVLVRQVVAGISDAIENAS
ncbi:MAG: phosphoglucosamine mutase, partial [Devosiaceae bacterium]|nr:phosphoglucosamine mutase [Devosiaceae bacterium]